MADRSEYRRDLIDSMMGQGSRGAAAATSSVRPLEASRSFSQAYARQRERRIARELRNIARVTGNSEGYRLAARAERDIAIAGRSRDAGALSTATPAGPPRVWVESFTKKDGTRVPGHWRTNPNPAQAEPTPLARATEAVLGSFGSSTYTPLGPAENIDGGWYWRDPTGKLIAAGPRDVLDRRTMQIVARNERRPFPEAHERAQGVGLVGKVLGLMGLDESGERARTSWGEAWQNTQSMSLLNMLQGGYIAAERGLRERRGRELDRESAGLAMEAVGTVLATTAPGVALAGPKGTLGSSGGKPPRTKPAPDLNALGLYSRLARAIDELPKVGTPRDMLNRLDRILGPDSVAAREEMDWTGVRRMLEERAAFAGRPGFNIPNRITRDEIRQYFDQYRIDIEQIVLGGPNAVQPYGARWRHLALNPGMNYRERLFKWMRPGERQSMARLRAAENEAKEAADEARANPSPEANERLRRAEAELSSARYDHSRNYPTRFLDEHWEHLPRGVGENLAGGHVRTSMQVVRGEDGRFLTAHHIDEAQSEWNKTYRKHEKEHDNWRRESEELRAQLAESEDRFGDLVEEVQDLTGLETSGRQLVEDISDVNDFPPEIRDRVRDYRDEMEDLSRRMESIEDQIDDLEETLSTHVHSGPFVTNTQHTADFQLSTQLIEAARNPQAQALSIVNGVEVARRFGLYTPAIPLRYFRDESRLVVGDLYRPTAIINLPEAELRAQMGRQYPEIVRALERDRDSLFVMATRNPELDRRGRGNVEFYDNILRQRLQRLVRRVDPDARVRTGYITDQTPQLDGSDRRVRVTYVEMTPRLRERLINEGLPLMVNPPAAGAVAVAASQGPREREARARARRYSTMLARARGQRN